MVLYAGIGIAKRKHENFVIDTEGSDIPLALFTRLYIICLLAWKRWGTIS